MDKILIIDRVKELLPDIYKDASIFIKGSSKPFYSFLETDFINYIKDEANPTVLVRYIKNKLQPLITFKPNIENIVNNFIMGMPEYVDTIQTGPVDFISAREYLIDYLQKNMDDEGNIFYPGINSITIEGLYKKLVDNAYKAVTMDDKKELCSDMLRYIDDSITSSIIEGMGISVADYVTNILPTLMIDATSVKIAGQIIGIDDLITQLVEYQRVEIENSIEKEKLKKAEEERLNKEMEFNRTSDNPGLVGEIKVALMDNQTVQVSTEIPEIKSSNPDETEIASLIDNYRTLEKLEDEEYFKTQLNNIKLAIDNSTNEHDLASKEALFNRMSEQALQTVSSVQLQMLIESINELITKKRHNLIKVVNNLEDYIDVVLGKLNGMKSEIPKFTSADEFSKINGELRSLENDILSKGIKDYQLSAELAVVHNMINSSRLTFDSTIPDQSPEIERVKVEIYDKLMTIQSDILKIEHDPNNLGNLEGTKIRLENNINVCIDAINNARREGMLNSDDLAYYMNKIDTYKTALTSEARIGYGIR